MVPGGDAPYGASQDTLPLLWWDIYHGDTVGTEKCMFRVERPGFAPVSRARPGVSGLPAAKPIVMNPEVERAIQLCFGRDHLTSWFHA